MLSWDEQICCNLINKILISFNYTKKIKRISWLTRVVSIDTEIEIRMVSKIIFSDDIIIVRITSKNKNDLKQQLNFQKLLSQNGFSVPTISNVIEVVLSERISVIAYLEEYINGDLITMNDFDQYITLLGKLHKKAKCLDCSFSVERNHILYDSIRITKEIENSFQAYSINTEPLIQTVMALMCETKTRMKQLKRYPIHGDYSTSNLIKKDNSLYLIDFELSGLGYLPEEAGEAFAEIICSCSDCYHWNEQLERCLMIYKSNAIVSELELELIKNVAIISLIIRILHMDFDGKKKAYLCNDIINNGGVGGRKKL